MAKFYGYIGFASQQKVKPGIWENVIVEKPYFGDVVREAVDSVGGQTVLGDRKVANSFRIIADPYAQNNFMDMEYILWNGVAYTITQVELDNRPRMLIRIGGVYNGPTAASKPPGGTAGD